MKPENTDKPQKADCPSAPCSPSSTPETDAILGGANAWNAFEEDIIAFARKLERERNESRKLADDAMATLREIKDKYGLGDRHVMREKNREIATLREALRLVDGHLEIIEDYGHGPHMDNATIARGIIAAAISSENAKCAGTDASEKTL